MDKYAGTDVGIFHVLLCVGVRESDHHKLYRVKCKQCGFETDMAISDVKRTAKCTHLDIVGNIRNYKSIWIDQRLRTIFDDMVRRCYDRRNKSYRWYGAKGIKVCAEWIADPKKFEEWAITHGYNPSLTIDRIRSNEDYSPENCRWISASENARRAGIVNWIAVDNTTLTGRQWAQKLGIGTNVINTAVRTHGIDKTVELIALMLNDPPAFKKVLSTQSWFDVYKIDVGNDNGG